MKTKFEQGAFDIQKRKARPSYPHEIETYTGNNKSTVRMSIEIIGTIIVWVGFIILLMAITQN